MKTIETRISEIVDYECALKEMEGRVEAIIEGRPGPLLWFLEHPPLYTAGTSAVERDLLTDRFPVYKTGRGGQYTYHGPGQRVVYLVLPLKQFQETPDLRAYIAFLEGWIIAALEHFGIEGVIRKGRVGVWVPGEPDRKIAAIGVRVRKWVAYHGIALNVDPDLSHFEGIVPCGLRDFGVTSLREVLGRPVSMEEADAALQSTFGPTAEELLR